MLLDDTVKNSWNKNDNAEKWSNITEKSSHIQIYGDPFVRDLGNGYTQPANCLINSTSIKSMWRKVEVTSIITNWFENNGGTSEVQIALWVNVCDLNVLCHSKTQKKDFQIAVRKN